MSERLFQRFPFLRFLSPAWKKPAPKRDPLVLRGHVKVEAGKRGGPQTLVYDSGNLIVDQGITAIRDLLLGTTGGGIGGSIFRMAIGDGGCLAGELYNPRTPDASRTDLFHEIYRKDIGAFSTPTADSARFVCAFDSADVDPTGFSLAEHVVNEACLIIGDGVLGGGDIQVHRAIIPAEVPDGDEQMVSIRTFKSAPFEPGDDTTVTITWTMTVAST